jgi:hypothetical protein
VGAQTPELRRESFVGIAFRGVDPRPSNPENIGRHISDTNEVGGVAPSMRDVKRFSRRF